MKKLTFSFTTVTSIVFNVKVGLPKKIVSRYLKSVVRYLVFRFGQSKNATLSKVKFGI